MGTSLGSRGRVIVRSGDIIVGDCNGVVVVPQEHAKSVLKVCRKAQRIDRQCLESLQSGKTLTETLAERNRMLAVSDSDGKE